jgi:Glycosyltransferases involved in cell wall biogenesis
MTVSVIIPCYNVEDYVADAVASVARQTYGDIEIICIDNNSTDNTWQRLQQLQQQYGSLITIDREITPGANAARNKGLQLAKGQWAQFLDADDVLLENKLAHQAALLGSCNSRPAFIAAASKKVDTSGKETIQRQLCPDPYLAPFINQAGITSANLWSVENLKKVGSWNETIKSSQETELMLRLVLAGETFITDDTPLTLIRERPAGQISQSNPAVRWKRYLEVRLNYLEQLKTINPEAFTRLTPQFYDFLMATVILLGRYDSNTAQQLYKNSIQPYWHAAAYYGMNPVKRWLIRFFGLPFYLRLHQLFAGGAGKTAG